MAWLQGRIGGRQRRARGRSGRLAGAEGLRRLLQGARAPRVGAADVRRALQRAAERLTLRRPTACPPAGRCVFSASLAAWASSCWSASPSDRVSGSDGQRFAHRRQRLVARSRIGVAELLVDLLLGAGSGSTSPRCWVRDAVQLAPGPVAAARPDGGPDRESGSGRGRVLAQDVEPMRWPAGRRAARRRAGRAPRCCGLGTTSKTRTARHTPRGAPSSMRAGRQRQGAAWSVERCRVGRSRQCAAEPRSSGASRGRPRPLPAGRQSRAAYRARPPAAAFSPARPPRAAPPAAAAAASSAAHGSQLGFRPGRRPADRQHEAGQATARDGAVQ